MHRQTPVTAVPAFGGGQVYVRTVPAWSVPSAPPAPQQQQAPRRPDPWEEHCSQPRTAWGRRGRRRVGAQGLRQAQQRRQRPPQALRRLQRTASTACIAVGERLGTARQRVQSNGRREHRKPRPHRRPKCSRARRCPSRKSSGQCSAGHCTATPAATGHALGHAPARCAGTAAPHVVSQCVTRCTMCTQPCSLCMKDDQED